MTTLLKVDNLSVRFKTPEKTWNTVVKNVSFDVEAGETMALVGESGSGKTVTTYSILGLLPYPMADHPNGSILFKGRELLNQGDAILAPIRGRNISMIFQEPMTALNPLHTIERQIAETIKVHLNLTPKQIQAKVLDLLKLVGFEDAFERLKSFPHQLSGGQRQRVMIAMALACEPELLIADEPTTAIDVTLQKMVLDLILSIQKRYNMGLILISHDLNMVARIADKTGVMQQGELVELGQSKKILKSPKHPYTKHLIHSEPTGHVKPIATNAIHRLSIRDLNVYFKKPKPFLSLKKQEFLHAVQHINMDLSVGETLGIVGESGSGKSSLVNAILRLIPSQGEILFEGNRLDLITQKEYRPLRSKIQMIFQDPFSSLNPRLTLYDIVAEGLIVHHPETKLEERKELVKKMLKKVGLSEDFLNRYPHEFSGGQRQRIAIARALILNPVLLILDEPTSSLDRSIQLEILDLLKAIQQEFKISYIFISHDLKVIRAISHNVIVMKDGQLVEKGPTEEIYTNPKSEYTQALIKAAFLN